MACSDLGAGDFEEGYWKSLFDWYEHGGYDHVAAYLAGLDISGFDPKAPPRKTEAFRRIVAANISPDSLGLGDALDEMGNPDATTIDKIIEASGVEGVMAQLNTPKGRRSIPHRLADCGYTSVPNPSRPKDGAWKIGGAAKMIYGRASLSFAERHGAAQRLAAEAS
jgi:hypothetical protein